MNKEMHTWYSPLLNRKTQMARWGTYGKPVILFPTAAADCLDYERFKLIWKLKPFIEAERIKVFSIESLNGESWLDKDAHPAHKSWVQSIYDRFITEEVLPKIEADCEGYRGYITSGASLGAYNALHAALRNPSHISGCISMSGTYDFDRWMHGHSDQNYYFSQPMQYLGNMPEGDTLNSIRDLKYVVASGSGRHEAPDESRRIKWLMDQKGIDCNLEIWGADAHHDWPTWRTMLPIFMEKML